MSNKLNLSEIANNSRDFYSMADLVNAMKKKPIVWSWGAHNFVNYAKKILKFNVQGRNFTGHVYIRVNGSDLFDIWLTTSHKTIKITHTDIYLEDLIEILDRDIEYIPKYS